jgi:hypothetical protein
MCIHTSNSIGPRIGNTQSFLLNPTATHQLRDVTSCPQWSALGAATDVPHAAAPTPSSAGACGRGVKSPLEGSRPVVQTLAQHLAHRPCHAEPQGSERMALRQDWWGQTRRCNRGMGWQHAARQQGHQG